MSKLQAAIIAAAAPFNLRGGPIGAFTAPHDNPAIDVALIDYVSNFEQIGAGEHFNPHVSTGNAPIAYLDRMIAEPFESFTFSRLAQPSINSAPSARLRRSLFNGI